MITLERTFIAKNNKRTSLQHTTFEASIARNKKNQHAILKLEI